MAIDQSTYMPRYTMGSIGETDEERRRREEEERLQRNLEAQAALSAGLPVAGPQAPTAMPGMSMTPEDAANTEVSSTQIKTYGDGSQEEIVKTQIPAGQPVAPEAQPMVQPQPMAQPQPVSPEQAQAPGATKLPPNVQLGPDGKLTMVEPGAAAMPVPATAPTPAISPEQAMPAIGTPPVPGPGVQVAGPAQMPPAPAPALAAPSWITEANSAGTDFNKLLDVAARFPESRTAIQTKLETVVTEKRKSDEAQKMVEAAQAGDPKAINKLEQALRPTRGREKDEVTVTDYLKAYMYTRLGLNDLAADVQKKIMGKDTKFGQLMLGNTNWQTETDSQGNIVRARDDEGNTATENTLNKLRAAGRAVTTAAPSSATSTRIRDSKGTEWSQVPTPQGMKFYNNSGKEGVPEGRTVPIAVGSDVETAQNMAGVKLQFAAPTAAATAGGRIAGETAATYGTPIQQPQQLPVQGAAGVTAPGPVAAPGAPAAVSPQQLAQQQAPAPARAPAAAPAAPGRPGVAVGGGGLPAGGAGMTPAQLAQRQELNTAAGKAAIETGAIVQREQLKPGAAAEGQQAATDVKNQGFADRSYALMKPINDAILKSTGSTLGAGVDTVAAAIGKSTDGSKAIARLNVLSYGILSNIPRFEGPQSDIDVQMYKQAAGDFANRKLPVEDRLAALDALRGILQRYDKAGRNDWTFGSQPPAATGGIRIIKREKVQ